jgi:hypothetical protein
VRIFLNSLTDKYVHSGDGKLWNKKSSPFLHSLLNLGSFLCQESSLSHWVSSGMRKEVSCPGRLRCRLAWTSARQHGFPDDFAWSGKSRKEISRIPTGTVMKTELSCTCMHRRVVHAGALLCSVIDFNFLHILEIFGIRPVITGMVLIELCVRICGI